ncbi:hypothetical protein [Arthrobacter sp. ISL-5]|uniref:hypothetical protein n=1 Tax=Arthrobacter sp. ISL-5 TaxID=2819111 RepID=UPI001BE9003C|nr:hypothetical protein [Arthrobacter sp. ISL-5]MBT2553855.1 hypothetical protein [Arthrobacter sp. ISL-5]
MNANVSPREPVEDTSPESTLRVSSVVSVPRELYAGTAPARYTVSARFSRSVNPVESKLIPGPAVRERLAEQGYGDVSLYVDDRRLEIRNTSLEELKSGLSTLIGSLVREISEQSRHEREQRNEDALLKSQADEARRKTIDALAHEISFD